MKTNNNNNAVKNSVKKAAKRGRRTFESIVTALEVESFLAEMDMELMPRNCSYGVHCGFGY